MKALTNKAYKLIFDTVIEEKIPLPLERTLLPNAAVRAERHNRRHLRPDVIIMSHDTFAELMRENPSYDSTIHYSLAREDPDRVFGVRVAYDNAMPFGLMTVAEGYTQ